MHNIPSLNNTTANCNVLRRRQQRRYTITVKLLWSRACERRASWQQLIGWNITREFVNKYRTHKLNAIVVCVHTTQCGSGDVCSANNKRTTTARINVLFRYERPFQLRRIIHIFVIRLENQAWGSLTLSSCGEKGKELANYNAIDIALAMRQFKKFDEPINSGRDESFSGWNKNIIWITSRDYTEYRMSFGER